jgi:hypothetical protein
MRFGKDQLTRRYFMKSMNPWTGFLALAFVVGFFQFAPALPAQTQSQDPSVQQQSQQKIRTFVGEIIKTKSGRYALLVDKQKGMGFYLDNQEKAKQFDGQNVKVTGTLDTASNTLHVTDIQPA